MATAGGGEEAAVQRVLRFSDVVQEPLEILAPIGGYSKVPLVSLEEAVKPLVPILPDVQAHAYVAKLKCKKPADNLTQDESASIMLYTMGWEPLDECLYVVLNDTLRAKNRQQQLPFWYLYLRLFLNALFRLPLVPAMAYRGVRLDLSNRYIKGESIVWWGFSSCTTSVDVLDSEIFLGKTGKRTMFTLQCKSTRDISQHSFYPAEDEVLLMAATQFKVKGCLTQGNLYIIQLEETIPPFPLLQPVPIIGSLSIHSNPPGNIPANAKWAQNGVTIAGGHGSGDATDQLNEPHGLFVDDDQTVVIAEWANHRIVQWKNSDTTNGQVVAGGNDQGNGLHQLNHPTDVLIDKEADSLIICDYGNRRVVRWSRLSSTTKGEMLIDNIQCYGVAMDEQRYLYVSDAGKHEVRRYQLGEKKSTLVAGGNGQGDGLKQLSVPTYLFVDRQQNVYVSDNSNHRVMKWNKGAKEGIVVAGGQGEGNALTQLYHPNGLFVDTLGTLYVSEFGNGRAMRWTQGDKKQGTVIVGGNGSGAGANQFNYSYGLSFDRQGNLYVVDMGNHRVQRFSIE
ncbi:unnamed protein product [Rotaria socialis]